MENLQSIKKHLNALNYKISVAESLSTGNIQASIGSISGATSFFEGGITVYSLEQKLKFLNIDKNHATEVNCVSEKVAKEMAIGVCNLFGTEVGISTTGYAEPYAAMKVKRAFAYFCIWNDVKKEIMIADKINLQTGSRVENQMLLTDIVIYHLSQCLKKV